MTTDCGAPRKPTDPERVQELFLKVVELPPQDRAAALDRECGDDAELRERVAELLAADEVPDSFLDGSADAATPTHVAETVTGEEQPAETAEFRGTSESRTVIAGRYTLRDKIGEGGMGEVWSAKQSEPVKRKVALKLIKRGMDSKAVVTRFEQERQALAMMDHPHIARVLDGGLTDDGQPFFVMELVNGLPLTQFCDEAKLSLQQRLELFVPICQAVQHAHQKGIVHRDLKPANILVTMIDGRPVPKVIDFGVAKATGGKLTEETMSTQFGAVVGTLEYMSPEQAGFTSDDIDTRADIYSLGVILYELLTGLRPIDKARLQNAALDEMIRIIREDEPSKPSTRLSTDASLPSLAAVRQIEPKKLTALLRGELDWVVMKCLEKQRDRRYETANALLRDIGRYLADEPVEARPPSAGYRLRKYVRRHRLQVTAAGLVLLTLIGGIIGTSYGLIRAEEERAEAVQARDNEAEQRGIAEKERTRADQKVKELKVANQKLDAALQKVTSEKVRADGNLKRADEVVQKFVTLIAQEGGPLSLYPGTQSLRKTLLEMGRQYFKKLIEENPGARLSPRLADANYMLAGVLRIQSGGKTESVAGYRKALKIAEQHLRENPKDHQRQDRVARIYANLGTALTEMGKSDEALAAFRTSLKINEELHRRFPKEMTYAGILALLHKNIGFLHGRARKNREAMASYRKAIAICQFVDQQQPDKTKSLIRRISEQTLNLRELAATYNNMATVVFETQKPEDATKYHNLALQVQKRLVKLQPHAPEHRDQMGMSYHNLSLNYMLMGQAHFKEALETAQRSLQIFTEINRQNPSVGQYEFHLGAAQHQLAMIRAAMKQPQQALKNYNLSQETFERVAKKNPNVPAYRKHVAVGYRSLGEFHRKEGNPRAALTAYRKALSGFEQLARQQPAQPRLRLSIAMCSKAIGELLVETGAAASSFAAYNRALKAYEWLRKNDPSTVFYIWETARLNRIIGNHLSRSGKAAEGLRALQTALKIGKEAAALKQPVEAEYEEEIAQTFYMLGGHYNHWGDHPKAIASFQDCLRAYGQLLRQFPKFPRYRWHHGACHEQIGLAYGQMGKYKEAVASIGKGLTYARGLMQDRPTDDVQRGIVATMLYHQGRHFLLLEDFASARSRFEECLALRQQMLTRDPRSTKLRVRISFIHIRLGESYKGLGNSVKAVESFERAIALRRKLVEEDPQSIPARRSLAVALKDLAVYFRKLGKSQRAFEGYTEAAKQYRLLLRASPENAGFAGGLGRNLGEVAKAHWAAGRHSDAKAAFEEARSVFERAVKRHPKIVGARTDLVKVYVNLAGLLGETGEQDESVKVADLGLQLMGKLPPTAVAPSFAKLLNRNLRARRAIALTGLGRYGEAARDWRQAMKLDDGRMRMYFQVRISHALARSGDHTAAVALAARELKAVKSPSTAYDFACSFAIAAGAARQDRRLDDSQREATVQRYATSAMNVLRKLAVSGFFQTEQHRSLLRIDRDLNALRHRRDFRNLAKSAGVASPAWARIPCDVRF